MPDLELRRATLDDLDRVAPLFDAYRQFYQRPADAALAREFLGERLQAGDAVIYLAEHGGRPAGFVQLYPVFSSTAARPGRLWLLNDLYVSPDARGAGVGRALMQRAAEHARDTGAVGLFLQTARDNAPARALYESLKWTLDEVFLVYELGTAP